MDHGLWTIDYSPNHPNKTKKVLWTMVYGLSTFSMLFLIEQVYQRFLFDIVYKHEDIGISHAK